MTVAPGMAGRIDAAFSAQNCQLRLKIQPRGGLPDSVLDRSIVIRLERRAPSTRDMPRRRDRDRAAIGAIQRRLARWIAAAVRAVMSSRTVWTGTATDLLGALAESAGERVARSKSWPASPRGLSGRLRRAATFLRKIGIEIDYAKEGRARTRIIRLTAKRSSREPDYDGAQSSAPSASSAIPPNGNGANAFSAATVQTVDGAADAGADAGRNDSVSTVRANSLKARDTDGADATDARHRSRSEPGKIGQQGWRATL